MKRFFLCTGLIAAACGTPQKGAYESDQTTPAKGDHVVVALQSEPVNLNPLSYADEPSFMVVRLLYQRLLELSPEGERFTPSLALRFPDVSDDGKTYYFEINPRADWNDEYPITGADVAFSLKLLFCPQIQAPHRKIYFEKIKSVEISPENPKKFAVKFKEKYAYALSGLGFELWVLPEYFFDPKGVLKKYPLEDLAAGKVNDPEVTALAEKWNGGKLWRNPTESFGSGPYFLKSWDAGRELVLERKKYWWGAREPDNPALQVFPERIVYRMISDETAALNALKNQEIDVLRSIPYRAFDALKTDAKVTEHYELSTPPIYAYNYIGMNNRPGPNVKPLFTDKHTRRAMAHLVDVNALVEHAYKGLARPMPGPVYPMLKDIFDEDLRQPAFNLDSAAALLARAGWTKNGDVLSRNGVKFETEFYYRQGNEVGRIVGAMLADNAAKIGIKIVPVPLDWAVMVEKQQNQELNLYISGWLNSPLQLDPKQLWHTDSWRKKGSNDLGFGNAETDRIIEALQVESDSAKRRELFVRFQRAVVDETPCVFLVTPLERYAVHKRFRNSRTHDVPPGFFPERFWVPHNLIKYKP